MARANSICSPCRTKCDGASSYSRGAPYELIDRELPVTLESRYWSTWIRSLPHQELAAMRAPFRILCFERDSAE